MSEFDSRTQPPATGITPPWNPVATSRGACPVVADLEGLLADRDPLVIQAAARALLALDARGSADKIEAAAAGPGAFYKATLMPIAAQLRGTAPAASASAAPR